MKLGRMQSLAAATMGGALMVLVLAFATWPATNPPAAYGQLPDAAAQRAELVMQARVTNEKLAEIARLLREIRDQRADAGDAKGARRTTDPRP